MNKEQLTDDKVREIDKIAYQLTKIADDKGIIKEPYMLDHWSNLLLNDFQKTKIEIIKGRCIEYGFDYHQERVTCVIDSDNNELYYYQTDSGNLQPIIAITPMEVSNSDTNHGIIVTIDCQELHMDIFKPKT